MGKFDGVLLATDFDDTYCPESGVVPQANLEAVAYFKAQGGTFTISTGRAHRTFAPRLSLAPVNAPVILSNGGQLYDFQRDEMVVEYTVPLMAGPPVSRREPGGLSRGRRICLEPQPLDGLPSGKGGHRGGGM